MLVGPKQGESTSRLGNRINDVGNWIGDLGRRIDRLKDGMRAFKDAVEQEAEGLRMVSLFELPGESRWIKPR